MHEQHRRHGRGRLAVAVRIALGRQRVVARQREAVAALDLGRVHRRRDGALERGSHVEPVPRRARRAVVEEHARRRRRRREHDDPLVVRERARPDVHLAVADLLELLEIAGDRGIDHRPFVAQIVHEPRPARHPSRDAPSHRPRRRARPRARGAARPSPRRSRTTRPCCGRGCRACRSSCRPRSCPRGRSSARPPAGSWTNCASRRRRARTAPDRRRRFVSPRSAARSRGRRRRSRTPCSRTNAFARQSARLTRSKSKYIGSRSLTERIDLVSDASATVPRCRRASLSASAPSPRRVVRSTRNTWKFSSPPTSCPYSTWLPVNAKV